jgi:hypothetical protein
VGDVPSVSIQFPQNTLVHQLLCYVNTLFGGIKTFGLALAILATIHLFQGSHVPISHGPFSFAKIMILSCWSSDAFLVCI